MSCAPTWRRSHEHPQRAGFGTGPAAQPFPGRGRRLLRHPHPNTLERILYRLSIGDHADQCLLKGALLFDLWFDLPARELGAYPRYSVVAEKLEAIATFGMANSRLKDYFDLWILATCTDFDGRTLTRAIDATFQRRLTPLPSGLPTGPTSTFADDPEKKQQWTVRSQEPPRGPSPHRGRPTARTLPRTHPHRSPHP
jgi:hypothetical protein